MKDAFDESFDELIEKGFMESAGVKNGEEQYRFTAKAEAALECKDTADQTALLLRRMQELLN